MYTCCVRSMSQSESTLAERRIKCPQLRFFATLMRSTTQPPRALLPGNAPKNAGARDLHRLF